MRHILPAILMVVVLASCKRPYDSHPASGGSEPRSLPAGSVQASGPILSYADVVDKVAPAVVTINASVRVRQPQQFPFADDPFFRQFFGGVPRQAQPQVERALGSGVVVRADGYLLTNHHVVDGAESITVELGGDRRAYKATVVGSDAPSDLAVLKISASDLPVLQLGDSDKVRVGDVCLAVGNPLGIGETVTEGIISAKGRSTESGSGSFQDFLQTDAPINKGNSGGALVNTRSELIGINSQILSPTGGSIGIGFAIPSNMARNVMNQLIGKGKVRRGMLGVTIQQITPDLAQSLGLPSNRGVLISGANSGGPGEKAGLARGDVVLKLNGKDVNDANVLRNEVAAMGPGVEVTLTILRDGKQRDVRVRLGELSEQSARTQESGGGEEGSSKLGISVIPLTPDVASELGIPRNVQGAVIQAVEPNSPAAQSGLRPGDVIQEVNRQPVRTPADVRSALQKSGNRPPLLLINRGGQTVYVSVPLG